MACDPCPFGRGLTTDVLIPSLGVDFPRYGGASLALTGAILSWTVIHYGMSFIIPRSFGDEILDTLHEGVALVANDGPRDAREPGAGPAERVLARRAAGMPIRRLLDRELLAAGGLDDLRRDLVTAQGVTLPVSVSISTLRERQQNEMGRVVVVRDLRELEDLRRSSMVNARLAAVGELAAGLAHEINNPIAFVTANLRLLDQYFEERASAKLPRQRSRSSKPRAASSSRSPSKGSSAPQTSCAASRTSPTRAAASVCLRESTT